LKKDESFEVVARHDAIQKMATNAYLNNMGGRFIREDASDFFTALKR